MIDGGLRREGDEYEIEEMKLLFTLQAAHAKKENCWDFVLSYATKFLFLFLYLDISQKQDDVMYVLYQMRQHGFFG